MRPYDLLLKKRNGNQLNSEEINFLIEEYTTGSMPDYQMAAFCMAVFFQGMSNREIADLTLSMANSGDQYDLRGIKGRKIDKHSTGGVGDTTTLIVAPLVASCGIPIAKMSGRSLGHTGGTIDKLESIPGFNVEISHAQFVDQVNKIQIALAGQSQTLAPADKKLYALRDVTATVDSLPLIVSSIMSKKLAAGADGFVLDVKTGRGALMQELDEARSLAKTMVSIGKEVGKPTVALVTDMNQPLGQMIGNSLEIQEAILTLAGEGSEDLTELSLRIGAEMLVLAGIETEAERAYELLVKQLKAKAGLEKLQELIAAQGGDTRVIDNWTLLPSAPVKTNVLSPVSGYITKVDALNLGNIVMGLGAGRINTESKIDLGVGIELRHKIGSYVKANQVMAVIHSNQPLQSEIEEVLQCFSFAAKPSPARKLIKEKITSFDV